MFGKVDDDVVSTVTGILVTMNTKQIAWQSHRKARSQPVKYKESGVKVDLVVIYLDVIKVVMTVHEFAGEREYKNAKG